jgi:Nucleotidyltransferase domain
MQNLRQWPRIQQLAAASAVEPFVGAVLLGSFAREEADELSDVDFIVFVHEGEFEKGWEERHRLHPPDAWCWDYPRPPDGREVAGHRWLTADFVLFDGLIATPSGTRVAAPLQVLVGGDALSRQLVRREPLSEEEKHDRHDEPALHDVERLYGELKHALRTHGRAKS